MPHCLWRDPQSVWFLGLCGKVVDSSNNAKNYDFITSDNISYAGVRYGSEILKGHNSNQSAYRGSCTFKITDTYYWLPLPPLPPILSLFTIYYHHLLPLPLPTTVYHHLWLLPPPLPTIDYHDLLLPPPPPILLLTTTTTTSTGKLVVVVSLPTLLLPPLHHITATTTTAIRNTHNCIRNR